MISDIQKNLKEFVKSELGQDIDPVFTRTDENHGDFACNVAMQLAGQLNKNPREIAQTLVDHLVKQSTIKSAEVAGPGFINIRLQDHIIFDFALKANQLSKKFDGKQIVAEYSDPNAFKVLHAGHLYTSLVGDAIANLLETSGGHVIRVNFGGDVGLHVGKAMWAIIKELGGVYPDKLSEIPGDKLAWVSQKYIEGNEAYETNEDIKNEIVDINKQVYEIHKNNDQDSDFAKVYWTCRQWSYEGFDALYKRLNMKPFDKYYPESSVFDIGLKTVREHIPDVYKESEGAIVFDGEQYGLFTQVFINQIGLPTYAGKDVGLIQKKHDDYDFDLSYMITDVSQKDHLAVVLKSIEQFAPDLAQKTIHQTHGRILLGGGTKMSSRKGNFLTADDVINSAFSAYSGDEQTKNDIVLGAIRYSFLKNKIGSDIIYEPSESVSLEGNSGPYLQYALVRARSILRKIGQVSGVVSDNLDEYERRLAFKLTQFSSVYDNSLSDYSVHHICTYLYELATVFNQFYENSRVIDHERSSVRAKLVESYEEVLRKGLEILGMPTPESM